MVSEFSHANFKLLSCDWVKKRRTECRWAQVDNIHDLVSKSNECCRLASAFLWIIRSARSGPPPQNGKRPVQGVCGAGGGGLLRAGACNQETVMMFFSATSDAAFGAVFECLEDIALGDWFHLLQRNMDNRS